MAGAASGYVVEEQALAGEEPVLDLEGGAAEAESDGTADEAPEFNQAAALRQLAHAAAAFPGGAVLHHDRVSQLRAEQAALRQDAKRGAEAPQRAAEAAAPDGEGTDSEHRGSGHDPRCACRREGQGQGQGQSQG